MNGKQVYDGLGVCVGAYSYYLGIYIGPIYMLKSKAKCKWQEK